MHDFWQALGGVGVFFTVQLWYALWTTEYLDYNNQAHDRVQLNGMGGYTAVQPLLLLR